MTDQIPFFDGHNDFLLRLMFTPGPREKLVRSEAGTGSFA